MVWMYELPGFLTDLYEVADKEILVVGLTLAGV